MFSYDVRNITHVKKFNGMCIGKFIVRILLKN